MTDLQMVFESNFVCYGHIEKRLVLCLPQFNFDFPPNSENPDFRKANYEGCWFSSSKSELSFGSYTIRFEANRPNILETVLPFMSLMVDMMVPP